MFFFSGSEEKQEAIDNFHNLYTRKTRPKVSSILLKKRKVLNYGHFKVNKKNEEEQKLNVYKNTLMSRNEIVLSINKCNALLPAFE